MIAMAGVLGFRKIALIVAIAVALPLAAAGCTPPSAGPGGDVSQQGPIATNGLAWDGDTIWICDYFGGQLLNVDSATGRVLRRVGPDRGLTAPDDLVVLDDGTLITMSPTTGLLTRVPKVGPPTVVARLSSGSNPIALEPGGGSVYVGYALGTRRSVDRVDLATGQVVEVARGLPDLNAFSLGPDGALWAPADGALGGLLNNGRLVRIDVTDGSWRAVPVSFAGKPGKAGFAFGAAAKWSPDGRLRVIEGFTGTIYDVAVSPDGTSAVATPLASLPGGLGDNMAWGPDGRFVASGFLGGVYEVGDDGAVRRVI